MKRVQIRKVARLGTGHTPSRSVDAYWEPTECTIPWLTLADVWQLRDGSVSVVHDTKEKISPLGLANSAAVRHPAGTVAFSRTASVGFSCILGEDMATSQDFVTWTCGPQLDPRYLLWVLRGERDDILRRTQGSTHKTIYMPDIEQLTLPLPPLDEQRRIVEYLDRETSLIDTVIDKKTQLMSRLDERTYSFTTDVAHRAVAQRGEVRLRRCVVCLDGRRIPLDRVTRAERPGPYPYWGAGGVVDSIDAYLFNEPLVLLGEDGAPFFDRTRPVAFAVDGPLWVNNHIHALRPRSGWLASFLETVLNVVDYGRFISGSTRDKLTQSDMLEILIPHLDVSEQQQFLEQVARARNVSDTATARVASQLVLLREHRQALVTATVTGLREAA
ncbi:MAG: restriction endonuclease subunit S [Acidimicrobiia bacterium]